MTRNKETISAGVAQDFPYIKNVLAELVQYESLAFPGYDPEPNRACGKATLKLVRAAGFTNAELVKVGPGFDCVWATHHISDELPTVLLYAHYDIQPAPLEEQGWETDPFTLVEKEDGRLYARGAADDKSGIAVHLGAIRALGGLEAITNCNIKLCIEGEEEAMSYLDQYIIANPEKFQADVYIISDSGNLKVGEPVLENSLRGAAILDVEVKTIKQELHSGLFGGVAPDAFLAACRLVDSMFDEAGNTRIEGIEPALWEGAEYPEELLRSQLGLHEGVELLGSDSIASRLWSKPSLTVTGLDMQSIEKSANVIIPSVKLRFGLRIPPQFSAAEALEALKAQLQKNAPYGVTLDFGFEFGAPGFYKELSGPLADIATSAMTEAFGYPCQTIGCGASIPLVYELNRVNTEATILIFGAMDMEKSRIHGGNESVDIVELQNTITAEALMLSRF